MYNKVKNAKSGKNSNTRVTKTPIRSNLKNKNEKKLVMKKIRNNQKVTYFLQIKNREAHPKAILTQLYQYKKLTLLNHNQLSQVD